ncbi:alpha/beta hydrolase-fold protein [Deinococcus rubellus]|uniref:Alpha/beta hydrolase-fold protein n=1 Tax=Deinococcus rubellus TaxID=1889240 RepID=A0ABY5YDV4_9DEIO|nr:alpha/beta hydrolase-fold protein [Deinococcus rubellus]UWX63257.1 alpha/beta hydrolase-fold protein [Deinococcus rubellus]
MPFALFMPTAEQMFVLDVPADTPADAEFFLQTNLSGYAPARPEYRFVNGMLRAEFPLGALLTYKVTRGSAESEEGDQWGERRPERRTIVEGAATHHLRIESWQDLHSGAGRPSTLAAGIETLKVHNPELDDDFTVLVWTPPEYAGSTEHLPVLYLHDGQNVFDAATSFAGETWGADIAASQLAAEGLPCILVAVSVREKHRASDYVPFPIRHNDFKSTAPAYQTFLAQTLKPHIDARYRTRPERQHTAQAGSSFGGVASLYGTLSHPDVWGTCGVFSPSLWVQDGALMDFAGHHPTRELRLYVDMGTHEGLFVEDAAAAVRQTQWFAARSASFVHQVNLQIGMAHWHDEPAWRSRLPDFLRWWLTDLG